ncbi:LysR substrate-binding domain-containing protein [Reyranella sp. CPCC 100927]|uniref:LysR substrate-binding domain-containing protein n=1 Tax=Reyranella sp. CPCC 100927 TaxID=2599616 RepID=UPI0015B6E40A|nr:LysR substrate-binding domain-containing protein [Reyranella sp. CPCC 100927]
MIHAPDLEILVSFVRVADVANFTKAARLLNRSQSTVSLHISRVEELYRCRVFQRSTKAVVLTPEGEILLSYARRMIQLHQAAATQLHGRTLSGALRVGIMEDFAVRQLPHILRQFAVSHPNVELELLTAVSADLMSALDDGRLDVVLARRAQRQRRGDVIWREPLSWVVARDHHPAALDGPLPLVLFAHGCFYRPLVIEALDARHIPWTIACTSTSLSGVCAAVGAGFGITVLADSTITPELKRAPPSLSLPRLPATEIAVFCGRQAPRDLAAPLVEIIRGAFSTVRDGKTSRRARA